MKLSASHRSACSPQFYGVSFSNLVIEKPWKALELNLNVPGIGGKHYTLTLTWFKSTNKTVILTVEG